MLVDGTGVSGREDDTQGAPLFFHKKGIVPSISNSTYIASAATEISSVDTGDADSSTGPVWMCDEIASETFLNEEYIP